MIAATERPGVDQLRAQRDQVAAALQEAEAAEREAQEALSEAERLQDAWKAETGQLAQRRRQARTEVEAQDAQRAYDDHLAEHDSLRRELQPLLVARNAAHTRAVNLARNLRQLEAQLAEAERWLGADARSTEQQAALVREAEQALHRATEGVQAAGRVVEERREAYQAAKGDLETARQAQRVAQTVLRQRQEEAAYLEAQAERAPAVSVLDRIRQRLGG